MAKRRVTFGDPADFVPHSTSRGTTPKPPVGAARAEKGVANCEWLYLSPGGDPLGWGLEWWLPGGRVGPGWHLEKVPAVALGRRQRGRALGVRGFGRPAERRLRDRAGVRGAARDGGGLQAEIRNSSPASSPPPRVPPSGQPEWWGEARSAAYRASRSNAAARPPSLRAPCPGGRPPAPQPLGPGLRTRGDPREGPSADWRRLLPAKSPAGRPKPVRPALAERLPPD